MKRKVFSLMMGLVLAFTGLAKAGELTVNDGTTTNAYVPVYGYYADAYIASEFILPASQLTAMTGEPISQMKFYASTSSADWSGSFRVFMMEVPSTTLSSFYGYANATTVYQGSLSIVSNQMVVNFTTPYTYNGGNLLIGFYEETTGGYATSTWYGVSATGACVQGYSYSGISSITPGAASFLPKTTFKYGTPEVGEFTAIVDGEVVDTINVGARPSGAWMRPFQFTMAYEGEVPAAISVLDFTPNDGYFSMVDVEYPIEFRHNDEVGLAIATGRSEEGLVERQFVAIYEGTREAAVWDITAEAYTPVEPDVWEMARVINDAYPFEYRNTATEGVTLYDNYLLPGDAEDGPDAVYKVTFDQDVMLNGTVTTVGTDEMAENAKMAVYTQAGIDEVGGPDLTNFYVGPTIGGGSGSEPYDLILGDGTGFNSYQPYYTLYYNSLSQQLYQASLLQEAGMGAGVISTIGYYTESSYSYTIGNVKIYMANVSDAEAPATSMPASAMTLVYEGNNLNAVYGWNDFALNGNFSWDGTSNLLVMFQRNCSEWHGGPTWQYTAQSYTAGAYDYDDNIAFDPSTSTYSLSTTTNLPNTHFVGGGREAANRDNEYIIENMTMVPGTYYIAASSTEDAWDVVLNAEELPCPEPAFAASPEDDADGLEPAAVTLSWQLGQYATEYRLVFGSTYYCEDVLVDWTTDLAQSYTVRNLYNNTNYFWRVDVRNGNCETLGEVWGFTTHLNVPQNLRVADETIFEGEGAVLSWNAIQDRTYRYYNIYQDGELIGSTPANQVVTTYTVEGLTYNMDGVSFYVTAVYDEGESAPSNEVNVKVSGNGSVAGHVYEMDGTTGIAGATVTFNGTDEFGDAQTFDFITDGTGAYGGAIMAGSFNGMAACTGYQTITEPLCGNPVEITYEQTTTPVDFVMDENFDPVCSVVAQYYPDSLNPASEYVKVYWGCGLPGGEIIEDFETGDFSKFDWQVSSNYPWEITTNNPYEGAYCMKSGGAGVASVVSDMSVTVEIPADGVMSFFSKISCESSWDNGYFYIDGVQKGTYTGTGNWGERTFDITAGEHTFKWSYTKDSSVNSGDDCFYVDYITFYRQPEPPVPGTTYTFDDGTMQGWTTIDADGDGRNFMVASSLLSGVAGHNGSADFVLSQSYDNSYGVLYPDNYFVSPQVELGGIVKFYACGQDANYAAEHFGLAVSTTGNTNAADFTTVQEWTLSAKSGQPNGKPVKGSRSGRDQGNWYEYTVDLSAYSGMGYVAIRHFNCSDQFYLDVDDITIGEASKGANDRAFSHYRVYRTNCYNDGPYTLDNTVVLACELMDTLYIDVEWGDLEPGVYKYGVGVVYSGNRGQEIAGPIHWANVSNAKANVPNANSTVDSYANSMRTRDEFTYSFEGSLEGWTTIDADGDSHNWLLASELMYGYVIPFHSGADCITSESYSGTAGVLNPDNYLVSPQMTFGEGASISFWASAQDPNYPAEHFGVAVSTSGNTSAADFTTIAEWTMAAKSAASAGDYMSKNGRGTREGTWYQYTVDLSSFSGQGYVAIRHFNCSDWFYLNVDDVTITTGTPGPTPDPDPIQEPRESEIVWSNCLDKDMYLEGDVTINVLLNSADNPEGTTVTFTNLNEAEQELYPMDPITLDETGFYAFDSFRKGDYSILIKHDGYFDIAEEVNIWQAEDLRYVMTEIIYQIDGLYVSSTGWAMWAGQGPGPVPPIGDTEFTEDFEDGLGNWTMIDADGDGNVWFHSSQSMTYSCYDYTGWGHNTTNGFAISQSYTDCDYSVYDADNYLVTSQKYTITDASSLSFWADYANDSYPDYFSVCVATADNPTAADFTQVWGGTAKANNGSKASVRHNENRYMNWRQHTIDLSAYAGQNVYIAFRHTDMDNYELFIDDVQLSAGRSDDRHLEYYKVMCTSIDGQAIFNADTEHPFCQVATDELVEGEHYKCKVAAVYSTGMSDWAECEWAYIPCDNYAGTTEGVVEEDDQTAGNHFSWTYPTGPVPPPGPGDEWSYSFDNGLDGWTTINANNDDHTWYHSNEAGNHSVAAITSHSGAGHMMSESYCNATWLALNPDDYLVAPAQSAITNGSTFSFWACAQDASYAAEHFGVAVSTTGNTNAADFTTINEWTLTAKDGVKANPAATRNGKGTREGNWYNYSVDLSAYAGQNVWIAIRHFNCSDQFILCMDDAQLAIGAKGNREMWDLIGSMSAYEAAHYGVVSDGEYIYTSNWGYASAEYNFCKYDMDGNFIEGFNIAGCGTIRDLDYDGEFFYGGANSNVLYTIDLANHVLVNTTTTGCSAIRHCSYDPQNDGFWVGGWDDLMLIDRNGSVIQNAPAPSSCAGSGYYQDENGNGHVYLWCEPQSVYDYNVANNNISFVTNLTNVPGWDGSSTAGGAFVGAYNGLIAFYCNIQQSPNVIGIYELSSIPGPVPPTPEGDVIGAMIFRDGEWLAEVAYPTSEYIDTDEFERHEYCVRLIYNGTNTLPEGNIYYSMSCPECKEIGNGETQCAAGADIRGEYQWHEGGAFGALISWGEQVPPIVPVEEWLYYDDGTYASSVGTGSPSPCYWGIMIPATSLSAYDGCNLTQVAVFDAYAATYTCNIYYGGNTPNGGTLVHTQNLTGTGSADWVYATLTSALPIDATQNLWITFYCNTLEYPMAGSNDTGDANGRWVSLDGSTWEDIAGYNLNYTWMIRGFVTNQAKGGSIVALDPFQGGASEGTLKAIAGSSNVEFDFSNRAAQIVKYNVYRSTSNANYELIGSVNAVAGQDYYEYFDEIAAGTYYYQVTAVYDNECESDPALAENDHANDYVIVTVTGIEENSGIALYPNPTSGNVKIEAVGMNHITVVSALGQVVYDAEISCDEYELNMAQFNAGIYMVRISSESGVSTQRVTVVR